MAGSSEGAHGGFKHSGFGKDLSVEAVADYKRTKNITIKHVDGPMGVRGRNSDNSKLREVLKWEPKTPLEEGMVPTYRWIEKMVQG